MGMGLSILTCTAGNTSDSTAMASSTTRLKQWNVSRLSSTENPP